MAHLAAQLPVPMMTINSLLGIIVGGGSLYTVAWVYYLFTKKEGMGGGDIKLLAMIGALIGWEGVFFTIFIGSAVGTIAGIGVMISTRLIDSKLRIPFGPFLAIGAVTYVFFGSRILFWYFSHFQ
jgi:leader peptidase (prepilin peptidase)/N-methyltransferase